MSTEAMRAALAALSNEDMSPAQAWELKQRAMTMLDAALAQPVDDGMCPNCVTPWKCNGPHIAPAAPAVQRADEPTTHLYLVEALKLCAVLFDNIASYEDGHRYTATLGAKGARAAIAATPTKLAADNFEWSSLYNAVSHMMQRLGADGSISTDAPTVDAVMDALHRLDAGQFVPGLTPRASKADEEEIAELKEAYALLFKANSELRASLGRSHVLHECLDNDSPWLICKHCGAVGRCEMEKS
jgi:hypothetical protein